jgi:superfamily II RNA helicase
MVKVCNDPYPSNSNYESYFELYSFPLSDFQKYAIEAIVEGHHTLVTAHTGSGKTLPAEFAINHFVEKGKKVVYTSPIKALSNQKFFEFTNKYPHITFGLMTGDIKLNPNADVIIMTTEILMNYLFNSVESSSSKSSNTSPSTLDFQINLETELACVVFDEVHYINDAHRGQSWEQTILMLPKHVQMVMLSATIDSPEKFAKWCERDDETKIVYLASTNKRVVPLTHYGYITATEFVYKGMKDKVLEKQLRESTNKLITLQTESGKFQESGYKELKSVIDVFEKKNVYLKRPAILNNLAIFLRDREMLPAIGFVFSRKHVEKCAKEITVSLLEFDSKVPYTVRRESEQILRKLPNYQEYLNLPEYNNLVSLLEKGVGIHHSGMIPILREIVELFISKKYIKLLFATESFAIGLDCPIKTAIFTGLTKYDGSSERFLMSHEYTQMAGRAGRRGIDTIGHVVHMNNLFEFPTMTGYKDILCGNPQKLISKFHISYSVILNMLKQNASVSDICQFVKKSMIFDEINKSISHTKIAISKLENAILQKQNTIKALLTEKESILRFLEIDRIFSTSVNKQRKLLEKERSRLIDNNKHIVSDAKYYKELETIQIELRKETEQLLYLESFIDSHVGKICNMLEESRFIEKEDNTNNYILTQKGVISANTAEVHPLVIADIIETWDYFCEFTPIQLVGLFSCFADVKVNKDMKRFTPSDEDVFLKNKINEISKRYEHYDKIELERDMRTGINYNDPINFDITDEAMEWCSCENEEQCKILIQSKIMEKGISIGDFTKAILKISVISKELCSVCEKIGEIDLLHKLSQIDSLVLKYITVNQSLYV